MTHTVPDEGSRLIRSESVPLYRVTDKDGRSISYKTEHKNGVLTITVDADFAVLTGKLSSISTLKAQGVGKLVFVTKSATSTPHLLLPICWKREVQARPTSSPTTARPSHLPSARR